MDNSESVILQNENNENGLLNITQEDVDFEIRLMNCVEKSEELLKNFGMEVKNEKRMSGSLDTKYIQAIERSTKTLQHFFPSDSISYDFLATEESHLATNQEDYLIYEGTIDSGTKEGYGKLLDANGLLIYEGNFKNGKYDGEGCLRNLVMDQSPSPIDYTNFNNSESKWEFYKGSFKEGRFEGSGEIQYTNGEFLKGNFIEGKVNGSGQFTSDERNLDINGIWVNNQLVSANL